MKFYQPGRLARPRPGKKGRSRSRRRLVVWVGISFGVVALVVAGFVFGFGGAILSHFGKAKAERAFAKAYPGSVLRIGELDYAMGANRLVAQQVVLGATNTTLEIGQVTLTGVRWARLLWGQAALAEVLDRASLEAANLKVVFPEMQYGIRCARLQASVVDSELIAEKAELQPLVEDEALFAAGAFRTTRYRVVLPECRVRGLEYGDALRGRSYRARSVWLSRPGLDALINRDKPPRPFVKSPLMVHEALAAIQPPFQVDQLSITNGLITYAERASPGADPAVLTFDAVTLSVAGIANQGAATAAIELRGQGDLMRAGTLEVAMSIPITPSDLALHYSGSLSAMDLTRLDAFLGLAEHVRIHSGTAQEAAFDIEVHAGQAIGRVRAIYDDLKVTVLDQQTGTEQGFDNRVASFLANVLKIRTANAPDALGSMKHGDVNYVRAPEETFLEFVWFALRSGVMDVISH
ncbi:MAG: DUF748 domain-containing protein [Verrucomicrobia bacterium]|nr:DUF748 domain-containing protein [Verrucomicrobiota bacterium]